MVDLSQLEKVKQPDEIANGQARIDAKNYLNTTDWYVIRQVETGQVIPDDIAGLRAKARLSLTSQS